jgi:uncharacterized membrane protein YraQ (UPF0718 family)
MSGGAKIPVYIVTGFLGAGKSSFIGRLLSGAQWESVGALTVQFESGAEALPSGERREGVVFPIRLFERDPDGVARSLAERIRAGLGERGESPDEIWIEWNGAVPCARLRELLSGGELRELCSVRRVIHVADAGELERWLGKTGAALPEQVAASDLIMLRHDSGGDPEPLRRARKLLRVVNPGAPVYAWDCGESERGETIPDMAITRIRAPRQSPLNAFFIIAAAASLAYIVLAPLLDSRGVPASRVVNIFLGIILQSAPFLLIGVLLSSAIEVFVTRSAIERRFPKSAGAGLLTALFAGFLLPVCDCASIPIFRALVRKGVPLYAAVVFVAATPVINPVVMLSTYYAFGGDLRIVAARVLLGLICAAATGLTFAALPPRESVLSGGALDSLTCGCGYFSDTRQANTLRGKLELFTRHAQEEFWNAGKYLVIGTFAAAAMQPALSGVLVRVRSGAGVAASLAFMMAISFALSLCSSSDAVVAKSFAGQFPAAALMGFLVFGPMVDIKNVMMLSSGFTKRFVARFAVTAFVVCFFAVFIIGAIFPGLLG